MKTKDKHLAGNEHIVEQKKVEAVKAEKVAHDAAIAEAVTLQGKIELAINEALPDEVITFAPDAPA